MQRDFTYIDDIVEGTLRVLDRPARHALYNIGNHQPVNLLDYIAALERAFGKKAKLEMKPMQPGDVKATYADTSALRAAVGFAPSTPLDVGLALRRAGSRSTTGSSTSAVPLGGRAQSFLERERRPPAEAAAKVGVVYHERARQPSGWQQGWRKRKQTRGPAERATNGAAKRRRRQGVAVGDVERLSHRSRRLDASRDSVAKIADVHKAAPVLDARNGSGQPRAIARISARKLARTRGP